VLAPVLAARPSEEAPPSYGAWLVLRPIPEADEHEEEDQAAAERPSAPVPSSVSFPQNLMTQSL
jgi:hypothetical protein